MRLTEAQKRVLKAVKRDKTRPGPRSDDWTPFIDLADMGLLEDLGLGDARITPAGRRALSQAEGGAE